MKRAHCVSDLTPDQVAVVVGVSNLQSAHSSNVYYVSDFIINPDYDPNAVTNDIAVLKLEQMVTLDITVQNICLPTSSNVAQTVYEKDLVLVGW